MQQDSKQIIKGLPRRIALMLLDWIIRHTTLHWLVPEPASKSEKE